MTEKKTNPNPHAKADGSIVCVQCGQTLQKPDGTVVRDYRLVRCRLTAPATPVLVPPPPGSPPNTPPQTAWQTQHPVICDVSEACFNAALLDDRWLMANAKGYEASILLAPGARVRQ